MAAGRQEALMGSRTRSTGLRERIGTHAWVRLPVLPDAPAVAPDAAERLPVPEARAVAPAR